MTRRTKQVSKQSKGNKRENVERRSDARRQKNISKKANDKDYCFDEDGDFKSFRRQMEMQGYKIKDVMGDGNCLFRALADQFNGDDKMHGKHRNDVVQYMQQHKDDFAPFLDETVTFEKYLEHLSSNGIYGGNDSIVAFARLHNLNIVIHQLNSPTFCINGIDDTNHSNAKREIVLHLAYHSMEHYSSVRRSDDSGSGPGYLYHHNTIPKIDEINSNDNVNEKNIQKLKRKGKEREKEKQSLVINSIVLDEKEHIMKIEKEETIKETEKDDEAIKKVDSEAIMKIQMETGYQDMEVIEKCLVDNSFDIDATLTFVLQLMTLKESYDDKANVSLDVSNPMEEQKKNNNKEIKEELPSTINQIATNNTSETKQIELPNSSQNIDTNNYLNLDEVESKSNCKKNIESSDDSSSCLEEEAEDDNVKVEYTEKRIIDSTSVIALADNNEKINNKNKLQVKKKIVNNKLSNKSKKTPNRNLSNRQRKELAKQERKKRREVIKKETSSNDNVMPETLLLNVKCINI